MAPATSRCQLRHQAQLALRQPDRGCITPRCSRWTFLCHQLDTCPLTSSVR